MDLKNRYAGALLGAGLLASSATAVAQGTSDVGCLLVSNLATAKAPDAKARTVAQAATYFYLGRIGPSITADQLKVAFAQQRKALARSNVAQYMNACVRSVQSRAKVVQDASQASSNKR